MAIGIDEVGRGCIAGDLVVCAFAPRPGLGPDAAARLRLTAMDSKAFRNRRRREAAAAILRGLGIFAIARSTPAEIDRMNIRVATLEAMTRARLALGARLEGGGAGESAGIESLFDGSDVPDGVPGPARAIVKGDASIPEIGAASIIAKTLRDAEMTALAKTYPGYGFEIHAGYATPAHRAAIARLGACGIHRRWALKFAT